MELAQTTCRSLQSLQTDFDENSTKQKEPVDCNPHDQSHTSKDLGNETSPATMNNQNSVLNMEVFDEKFMLSNIFKLPEDCPECASIKEPGINKVFARSSTLILEDEDEFQKSNCQNSLNSSDDQEPNTSTPDRKKRSDGYKILPPKIKINESIDEDAVIFNADECSPVKSPFPSDSLNDSSLGLDDTLFASSVDSSPKIVLFTSREKKLMDLLGRFGLNHFAILFIEQEVDMDLFLTLTNNDLKEIGIQRKADRNVILSVIAECKKRLC